MAKTAFISYASEDETVAETICAYLERNGVSCWIAPRDVRPGSEYASEIIDGIKSSAVFVLVLSEHANTSEFVKREVERAVSKGKPIFPVRVREVVPSKSLELFISSAEWIDAWQPPIEQYLERLAESIRSAAALYPPGHADVAATEAVRSADHRHENTVAAMPPATVTRPQPHGAQRALMVAVVALLALVGVLAALLIRNMARQSEMPGASVSGASGPNVSDPPTASASVVDSPGSVGTPTVVPGISATDPCPRSLGINRELPTPFSCTCSAQATAEAAIWGTDVYTDDSALCRAALHAGVISAQGGLVTVNRSPGRGLYVGTMRNGVKSNDFGAFPSSIAFKGTPPTPPGPGPCPASLGFARELPMPFTCRCSAQSTREGAVWGTDVYTDDSSLCRAALHAGRVSFDGGTITATRSEGRPLYVGSTRNGVMSSDFGAFPTSITFR
jgi:hypothetical protein